jgi:hypothetical protein
MCRDFISAITVATNAGDVLQGEKCLDTCFPETDDAGAPDAGE